VLLLKNILFTVAAPGTVAVYLPLLLGRTSCSPHRPGLATPLWIAGGAIYAWCVWDFATFGRGTPAPIDAPQRLVARGLYRFTRNPMYVGVLTAILGWAVFFGSVGLVLYAVLVATVFNAFVALYEEPRLAALFGAEYEAYRRRVGRWLPRLPGRGR